MINIDAIKDIELQLSLKNIHTSFSYDPSGSEEECRFIFTHEGMQYVFNCKSSYLRDRHQDIIDIVINHFRMIRIDYRCLLIKYINHIEEIEHSDYITYCSQRHPDISDEEWEELKNLAKEIN